MRRVASTLAIALTALCAAACGGGSTDSDEPLRAATDIAESSAAAPSKDAKLGQQIDLGDKVRVTVTAPTVTSDDSALLTVTLRVENNSSSEGFTPRAGIVCDGSAEPGGYQADSTLMMQSRMPARSYLDGTYVLILPGDGRGGQPVPECKGPASIVVWSGSTLVANDDELHRTQIPLSDDLVAQLNADRAQ